MRKENINPEKSINEVEVFPAFLLQDSLVLHGPVMSSILFKNINKNILNVIYKAKHLPNRRNKAHSV